MAWGILKKHRQLGDTIIIYLSLPDDNEGLYLFIFLSQNNALMSYIYIIIVIRCFTFDSSVDKATVANVHSLLLMDFRGCFYI